MSNAYDVVRKFESEMAIFCGAPYGVAVESCSAAIFLCLLKYLEDHGVGYVECPKITYPSVPASIVNAGLKVFFVDRKWQRRGFYELSPTGIVDCAKRIKRGMYGEWFRGKAVCLSFHAKKALSIGRGGMVLTDSKVLRDWLRTARFDGRHEKSLQKDRLSMPGWNMYLTPEQAARGRELMQWLKDDTKWSIDPYQDLSKYKFYK